MMGSTVLQPDHDYSVNAAGTSDALSGTEITLDNEDDTNPHMKAGAQKGQSGYGLLEWPALRRRLDRLDASYAE